MPERLVSLGYGRPANTLALALLVLGICTDNKKDPLALDDLALITDFFDGSSYFHRVQLFIAMNNSPLRQIVRTHFECHFVSRKETDIVNAHATRDVRQNLMTIVQTDTKCGTWQCLQDLPFDA